MSGSNHFPTAHLPTAPDTTGPVPARSAGASSASPRFILSFDIEEHDRIESAAGLSVSADEAAVYQRRAVDATGWLLDRLAHHATCATFFILGEFAARRPDLVRAIHQAGHEVASHGWNHQSVRRLSPAQFREDIRRAKDTLEQITGASVLGYRAPTFSIVRATAWALDHLVATGHVYDSSIYPVRHDRYGVPDAPRFPFLARGHEHEILELPPASYRILGQNIPTGGGGYFRLLPLQATRATLRQVARTGNPAVAMLYYHPWEFDPGVPRLALRGVSRWRTYVGLNRTRVRLDALLSDHEFSPARDVIARLDGLRTHLIAATPHTPGVDPAQSPLPGIGN